MIYCPIYQVRKHKPLEPFGETSDLASHRDSLRSFGARYARHGRALRRGAGTLRRRSPLALRLALAALAIAPHALTVVATKRRESNKTGVLYSGGAVSATTSPLRGSKTAVLYGSRFCCRSSNIVRCACGVPAAPPRYRMAPPPEGGLRADGFAASERALRAEMRRTPKNAFFRALSNTPPPRNLCGEHRTRRKDKERAPIVRSELIYSDHSPTDKCRP